MQDNTSSFLNHLLLWIWNFAFIQICPVFSASPAHFIVQHASSATFLNCAVTEDAGIEPRIVTEFTLTIRDYTYISSNTWLHLVHTRPCPHSYYKLHLIHKKLHLIHKGVDLVYWYSMLPLNLSSLIHLWKNLQNIFVSILSSQIHRIFS